MSNQMTEFYDALDWYYTQGDLEQVERFLLSSAERARTCTDGDTALTAVCNELGSFYRGTSRYAQSISAFERAKELVAAQLGEHCVQYATVLNNMAGTYRLMREFPMALELFETAMHIYEETGEQESYAYASVLNNVSLVYRETKQIDKAITYLERALERVSAMPGRTQEVAITYNNLTALYYASGQKERAMQYMKRALWEFEKCAEEENVHYAAGLNSLAGLLFAEGACERALELYRKSAKYTLRFFGENMEYGVTCQNMYWVYKKLGQKQEALHVLETAKRVYEKLMGSDHERTHAVESEINSLRKEIVS